MRNDDNKNMGIRLLKKGQKGIIHAVFSRMGLFLLLMLLQAAFLVILFQWFKEYRPHIFGGTVLLTVAMVLYLLNNRIDPTAKITWLVIVMLTPVFGSLLYLYTQLDIGHRALKARFEQIIEMTKGSIPQEEAVMEALAEENPGAASLVRYIQRSSCHPVYDRTEVTYFPLGEDKFAELLRQLEKAEHFIFLEYFIIAEGLMWGEVLEILVRKAREGVDVRVMYDGTCEFALLPHKYLKLLRERGIKCKVFSPVSPFISTHYNYRDHRKILVIDGHTAFNGGVNLADEYINREQRFGHWKDTAVMLKGDGVKSFTVMFLQMWNIWDRTPVSCGRYLESAKGSARTDPAGENPAGEGFVMPYGDSPLDHETVGKYVYMDILNQAETYVHITTPYLILDDETLNALIFAAKRGVEVVIIMPHIPDKKYAFFLAHTYYEELLDAGVQIYEFLPGFVHAKMFVSDGSKAVVGTINLDFRSLYHHFECAVYMYRNPAVEDVERDFEETLEQCVQITKETCRSYPFYQKLAGQGLRLIAPLM